VYPAPFDRTGWTAKIHGNDYPQALVQADQGWLDPYGVGFTSGGKPGAIHDKQNAGDGIIIDM